MYRFLHALLILVFVTAATASTQDKNNFAQVTRLVSESTKDLNGDGYYEHLRIEVELRVTDTITGLIRSRLLAADGRVVTSRGSICSSDFLSFHKFRRLSNTRTIALYFSGRDIRESGIDGPYTVHLELIAMTTTDTLQQIASFQTSSVYVHEHFNESTARFIEVKEQSMDLEDDQITDFLQVDITIEKPEPGIFEIEGYLYENTEAITKPGVKAVDSIFIGNNSARLRFRADKIAENDLEPPFRLELRLRQGGDLHDSYVKEILDFRTRECDRPGIHFCAEPIFKIVDENNDGYAEYLLVISRIVSDKPSEFKVCGTLLGLNSDTLSATPYISEIESRKKNCDIKVCKAGVTEFELKFNGQDMFKSGVDGPYVANLKLRRSPGSVVDEMSVSTPAYKHTDFSPTAKITGITDRPVNLDNDGLADLQQVDIEFTGPEPGLYHYRVWIKDAGSTFAPYISSVYLDSTTMIDGKAAGSFKITGHEIHMGRSDGPREMIVELFKNGRKNDSRKLQTSFLYREDYSDHMTCLIELVAESGIDKTNNGLYDVLEVAIATKVDFSGRYHLCGRLETTDGTLISARPTPDLWYSSFIRHEKNCEHFNCTGKTDTLKLQFSGQQIYEKMVNGPYYLKLYLGGGEFMGIIDTLTLRTSSHNFTDFRERPALEYVSTYPSDTSKNGRYDYLEACVAYQPPSLGPCFIRARLSADSATIQELADSLTIEPNTFPNHKTIRFDGNAIARNGIDAPYSLYIELEDTDGKIVSSKTVTVDGLRADQFEERE